LNDRYNDLCCDAAENMLRPRKDAASAIAASAKGGFVRISVVAASSSELRVWNPVTAVAGELSPDLVEAQPAKAFSLPRSITPPSGVSDRFDSGRTGLNCGAINFWQAPEKARLFECVSIWVKGG
jgi:hypothetical protein